MRKHAADSVPEEEGEEENKEKETNSLSLLRRDYRRSADKSARPPLRNLLQHSTKATRQQEEGEEEEQNRERKQSGGQDCRCCTQVLDSPLETSRAAEDLLLLLRTDSAEGR